MADVVLKAANAEHPKLRYSAGKLANRLRLLRRFAPAGLVDAGFERTCGSTRRWLRAQARRSWTTMKAFIIDRMEAARAYGLAKCRTR